MPIKKSAAKELRKAQKRTVKNRNIKENIKYLTKKALKAIDAKDIKTAEENLKKIIKTVDKAVQKKILRKNTGARKKSRLSKKVNAIKTK